MYLHSSLLSQAFFTCLTHIISVFVWIFISMYFLICLREISLLPTIVLCSQVRGNCLSVGCSNFFGLHRHFGLQPLPSDQVFVSQGRISGNI